MADLNELKKPVITLNDLAKTRGISRGSAAVELTRRVKKGSLLKVEKGKYAITHDVFAIATGLVQPSYISFGSALYLRGLLEQTITRVYVVSPRYKKNLAIGNTAITFVKFANTLLFGYERMPRGEFFTLVAETEKAIIDCLHMPRYFALSYLDAALKEINLQKFEEYALRMGSAAVLKRAGYLLERSGYETSLAKAKLSGVHHFIPGQKGKWNKKWRLYV